MTTFVYLHFEQDELKAVYLHDNDGYEFFDFVDLKISISNLTDACATYSTKSYRRRMEEIGDDLSVYDYLYSNDPVRAYDYLHQRRVIHGTYLLTLRSLHDLAAATLHRQFQVWLSDKSSQPTELDKQVVHELAHIQSILNKARHA